MSKRNTLNDLSDFLRENPNEIELGTPSKEEFIKGKPNNLVDIPQVKDFEKEVTSLTGTSIEDIANYLHEIGRKQNKSFAEVWMEILKEGSKLDPLLENTSIRQALKSFRHSSTAVAADTLSYIMKRSKK
ncbi:MAG: glutamyl-tRNA reductase [Parvicellaceae bacterium]|jgi:glutamyl-tRNA reductase